MYFYYNVLNFSVFLCKHVIINLPYFILVFRIRTTDLPFYSVMILNFIKIVQKKSKKKHVLNRVFLFYLRYQISMTFTSGEFTHSRLTTHFIIFKST